ncbi:MAG TPA: hypothetical protein VFH39_04190 [Candidatus Saccharimonadales bacterium]|nr:hypothetical protein [Candidatus Saccharimonadales bacterium]
MATPSRKWSISKRVSFAELGDGWQDCYATVSELSYLERSEFVDRRNDVLAGNDAKDSDLAAYVLSLVKAHFVDGKMLDDGQVVDMTVDDLDTAPGSVINLLLDGTLGVVPDPKGSSTGTETSPTTTPTPELPTNTNSTKTS